MRIFADILDEYPVRAIPDKIQYVDNKTFHKPEARRFNQFNPDLPKVYGPCVRFSKAMEQDLFLRFNYAKYRASLLSKPCRIKPWLSKAAYYKDILVYNNLPLAMRWAADYERHGYYGDANSDDRVAESNVGLNNAVDKFDISFGFRFSTYASQAIRRRLIRWSQIEYKHQNLELTPELEVDCPRSGESRSACDDRIDAQTMLFNSVPHGRERYVLIKRFGLADGKPRLLREIGVDLGITAERVRHIQNMALARLRDQYVKDEEIEQVDSRSISVFNREKFLARMT